MFNSIRKFFERGRKGYCYEDLWNWDYFFSKLIANSLREFKKNCHTYPNDIDDWEDWDKVLDEMIECFEEQMRGIENIAKDRDFIKAWDKRREHQKERLHRGLELLEKYYYDLQD